MPCISLKMNKKDGEKMMNMKALVIYYEEDG